MTFQLILASISLLSLLGAAYYFKHYGKHPTPTEPETPKPAVSIAPMSQTLHDAFQKSLAEIPSCQAIAYVDTTDNHLIGIESAVPFPPAIVELVAATVTDLFTAPNLLKMSQAFKQFKGQEADKSNFHEMVIHGDSLLYVLMRAHSNDKRVFVFACADDGEIHNNNIGLILHQARSLIPEMEVAAEAAFLAE